MHQKTLKKIKEHQSDKDELVAYGFKIETLQTWHWRITKYDYQVKVDVWPTKNKIWVVGTYEKASIYINLYNKVIEIFNEYMP